MASAHRLIEVFHEAKARPAGVDRDQFLATACQDDPLLKEHVVSLLEAHEGAGDFLKHSQLTPSVSLLTEKPGERIGHYKLLEQIGEGGFGVVWVAEQERPVRRRVALKIIKLGMDTREVIARFEQERQALAMMDHPNIAKVFEASATPSGRPFFVMELVRGIKITEYCDQANLATADRLQLFIAVCQAVQHAHQKGIIHRDLKPSNILVTLHDGTPVPKVIDFGVAKATQQQRLTDLTVYTQFEQMIGTPVYMSPEQAEMSGLDIDTRSDIYSLGVLLYELLTGRTPFDPEELMRHGVDEIRRTIREDEPKKPSTFVQTMALELRTSVAQHRHSDAAKLVGLIRGDLDWIVMKALEKDRTRRYDTATGLAQDIQRHLNNEPVVARPPSNLYRFQKLVRRNKLAVAAVSAVAAALVIGLGLSTWQFVEKSRAEREQYRLRADAVKAQANEAQLRQRAESNEGKAQTEARRAEDAAADLKTALAASDFLQAERLIAEDQSVEAVAYLSRILSANPGNSAASTRLVSLLTYQSWMVPTLTFHHGDQVMWVEFSPDGKRIATGSRDKTARVWDAQTGLPITPPLQHDDSVNSAQFSPDGKQILTASRGTSARVWDAQTGLPITPWLRHNNSISSAEFSPDGKRIVTASTDGTARIWDAQTGLPNKATVQHSANVFSAHFSPDGRRIVTASEDKTARVWDAETGRPVTAPMQHQGWVVTAQFSPDGRKIATASHDMTARVWDAETGQPLTEPLKHGTELRSAQFSPDGRQIVTVTPEKTMCVWDAQTGRLSQRLKHNNIVWSAKFSPDGRWIVTTSGNFYGDKTGRLWDAQTGVPIGPPLQSGEGGAFSTVFSPDGRRLVTTSGNAALLWQVQNAPPLNCFFADAGSIRWAQFSPDGKRIVTASARAARVWDARTGLRVTGPLSHDKEVIIAQFSPDGRQVATASEDFTARVWDASTGQPVTPPLQHNGRVCSVRFSPDGTRLATASWEKVARIWSAQNGLLVASLLQGGALISSVQFSPDGKQIVTASEDGSAWVWDAQTGQPITPHLQHGEHGLTTAQFSPNGKSILTTSLNSTAGLWDARNGEPLIKPLEQSNLVVSAQFSPDGRRILTLSADNTVRILDAQTGQPIIGPLQADAPVGFTSSSPDREKNTMFQWGNWLQNSQFPVMFSQDGQQFATASSDGIARVWDAQTGFPVTGLFLHGGAVWPVQFSPDGRQLLTASTDHRVRLWDLAPSEAKAPAWLLPMAEAISGKVLNKKGTIEKTQLNRLEVLSQLRQQFNQDPADNDWVVWGRWFLADPSTRTISPFSPITIREFIEHRLQECTAESLDDAERLAGVDSELLRRISEGRKRARAAYLESRIQESTTTSLDEAERLAEGNVDLLRRISQARKTIEENNRPMVLKAQADLLASQGKLIEAEPLYRQALLFNRNHWPNNPANWVSNLKDLVRVLTREGKPDAAEQLFNDILTPGLVTQPQSADLLRARGEFLARRGRWNDAAADFTKVIGLDPANHLDYHALAPLLVKSGKLEAYRENCRQALARFREAGNANVAERMAKDCLILPPSGVDSAVVDRWAERAVTIGKDSRDLPYFQFAKALAEYRQGRFASTVDWTQKALVKLGGDSFRDAQAYMVLAMAQHQLKQGDESHAALAKGLEVVDTHLPKLESGDIGDDWIDWIIAHALMSEARGLIEGK